MENMNYESLGNIGEFISAIAVIITLIYLALQLRQNTKSIRNNTAQELLSKSADLYMDAARDNEIHIIRSKIKNGEALTEQELTKFQFQNLGILSNLQNEYYQYCNGNIDDDLHAAYRARLQGFVRNSGGFTEFWKDYKTHFCAGFQSHVNSIVTIGDKSSKPSNIDAKASTEPNP